MSVFDIIFFLTVCFIYFIMFFVVKKDILKSIEDYKHNCIRKDGFVDNKINTILNSEKRKIAKFVAMVWPLYYPFVFGLKFGKDVYYLLIIKNYEDRIAARLV